MRAHATSQWLSSISAALVFVASACISLAQPYANYVADQWDTDTTGSLQEQGWGTARATITWDTNENAITTMAPNNPGSGSSSWSIPWSTTADQDMVARWFAGSPVLDLTHFTNVSFDIKFATNSATDGAGSYGIIIFGCIPQADGWPSTTLGLYTSAVTNGNGWIHVSLPINGASNPKFSAVIGYSVKIQQNRTGANLTGTTAFWLDNVIFGGLTNVPPPPTMSIKPVTTAPGLMIVAGGSGGTYTRGLMAALDAANATRNFSWVGSGSTPVTYSQTIVSYPDPSHSIQSAIFLVQNGNLGDPGVDYDAANVAQLSLYGNADGTATASFQYKTNQPGGNSQFTGSGNLASITAPSPLGTWSISFLNDTNVTLSYLPLKGGGGVSTNFNFPDPTVPQTYFANPLTVFMGNQQSGDGNVGQSSTYSEFRISGITASPSLDAIWTNQTTLDTTNWNKVCNAPDDILLVRASDKYWLNWTLPDSSFGSEVTPSLSSPVWTSPTGPLVSTINSRMQLISSSDLPAGDSAFFRLIKRQYAQLQILWPGETNAPDTATGKIGTPTPVNANDIVYVTINAVDSTYHIVNVSGDQIIEGTGNDPNVIWAGDGVNNYTTLSGGTAQGVVTIIGSGSYTLTLQDSTATNIPPATSSSITVN